MKQRASSSLSSFIAFSILLIASSCDPTGGEKVLGVTLAEESLNLFVGDSYTFAKPKISYYSNTSPDLHVTWASSNEDVAYVNEYRELYAQAEGTATITVTTVEGGKTDTCQVTVKAVIGVESVEIEPIREIGLDGSFTLVPVIEPANATNKSVTWYSSDENILVVDEGVVRGLGAGAATITVLTASNGRQASCEVTVSPYPLEDFGVSDATVAVGETVALVVDFTPDEPTHKGLSWSSDDETVATVDPATGEVTGVAAGTVVIVANHPQSGMSGYCTVTVTE